MTRFFTIAGFAAGFAGLGLATSAGAQPAADYEAIVRVMRECARIADVPARVACYDRAIAAEPQTAQAPRDTAPAPPPPRATGYGAEALPQTRAERAEQPERIELAIAAISEMAPRTYRLTVSDGGVWETTEAAPLTYDAPRKGSRIALSRAAMGGFQMEFAGQRSIRIRRVR